MTNDPNQIWNLLIDSKLLPPEKIQTLVSEFKLENRGADGKTLASWLVGHKHVTEYQAQVLMAELSGPFHYGNYTVTGRFKKGQSRGLFKAIHAATGHPVLLEFFRGFEPIDLAVWRQAEATVETASQIEIPQLMANYETVILKHHRFLAVEKPASVLMSEKLPRKARLPWRSACFMFGQIGLALSELHERGVVHGAVSPRTVWFQKNGLTQLRLALQSDPAFETLAADARDPECKFDYLPPEWNENSASGTVAGDVYSWACTFVRALHGRAPFAASSIEAIRERHQGDEAPDLSKYELPASLSKIIHDALQKNPADRPTNMREIADQLISMSEESLDSIEFAADATFSAYRKTLTRFKPGSQAAIETVPDLDPDGTLLERGVTPPKLVTSDPPVNQTATHLTSAERAAAATEAMRRRRKNRWRVPAGIASGLLLMSAILGVLMYQASKTELARNDDASEDVGGVVREVDRIDESANSGNAAGFNSDASPSVPVSPRKSGSGSATSISAMKESERPVVIQELVAEGSRSGASVWETPTTGPPVDFSGIPAAAKLVFVFRPSAILADLEGQRVIQGLGPEFRSLITQFERRSGLELKDISQLIVSLHSTPTFDYEPFYIVTTNQPIETIRLLQLWNRPTRKEHENGQAYYLSGEGAAGVGYYQLVSNVPMNGVSQNADSTSRFAVGSPALIEEVAGNVGSAALFGAMKTMGMWCDSQRHVNVLYLRPGLFNDEGQKLMGPSLRDFNRELSVLIPDAVRGGLFSLHLDGGTYLEMMFEHSLDVSSADLRGQLEPKLRAQRDRLIQFVAAIPSSKYWDAVRARYSNMMIDLFRSLRWGVEHGEVIANAWLPPMAAHNLIAGTELVISFSGGTSSVAATTAAPASGPKTIEELLAVKRDLNIANPPDLNLLVADIENEINEEYPGMPFKFRIRLLGADLQKDGITKNQRPSELNMSQLPLGEILTNIMTAANPSKDITGPEDPACKLIWVIADDPENPGQPAVLITTRDAAAAKSYTLPPQFQLKK